MTENFATNDLVIDFTEETGLNAFLAEAFEFDFSNEDDYQEPETLLEEDNIHEDSFYDHTFKKEFKAQRRERRKRNAYHDIRLKNRAEDALANYSKRSDEAYLHSKGNFKLYNAYNLAKKCKYMKNKEIDAFLIY